jgi:hypothetical protein
MAKSGIFQFTLTNEAVIKKLRAIPAKYRSLCMEMALDAWFTAEKNYGGCTISFSALTTGKKKNPSPTRFRISFSNKDVISRLINIHPRYLPVAVELVMNSWFESISGAKLFELLTARNRTQSTGSKCGHHGIDDPDKDQKALIVQTEKMSETERLIKIALEFK